MQESHPYIRVHIRACGKQVNTWTKSEGREVDPLESSKESERSGDKGVDILS